MARDALRDTIEMRLEFVRRLVMQGWLDEDIVRRCYKSDLFVKTRYRDGHPKRRNGRIGKRTIRQCYLYRVKKELREQYFDTEEEIAKAVNNLALAMGYAHAKENAQAVAYVQRVRNRMLGLRKPPSGGEHFDSGELRRQVDEMDDTIVPPGEDQ